MRARTTAYPFDPDAYRTPGIGRATHTSGARVSSHRCPAPPSIPPARLRARGNGGGGGNRTRVPECLDLSFYARSSLFVVTRSAPTNRIGADQLDCFSLRLGRVASLQPACCVAPWPPADKGTSASRLVIKQRGSSACWHLSFSSRIYEVPGPRRATSGRINIRSKPIAPRLDSDVIGHAGVQHKSRTRSCLRLHSRDPLSVSPNGV